MGQPRSFLIIQTAFIGDVILATALVESLHRKFPESPIDFLVRKGNEELLQGNPHLREVIVFDKKEKYKNLFRLVSRFRRSRYDCVINVQRFATTGLMTVLSGAGTTIGFDKNPFSIFFSTMVPHVIGKEHEVNRNHKLIEALVGEEKPRPVLFPVPGNFDKVRGFKNEPFITVSPASVWFTKQFPKEKWVEFLQAIPADLKVYLLGAANDQALCEEVKLSVGRNNIDNLAGKLNLLESAALMKDAKMNYTNDSAPMHLASAVNANVTAVFCSTVPAFGFGPLSDTSKAVETAEAVDCRPCGLHGFKACPQGHFRCASTIRKEQLLSTLQG